MLVRKVVVIIQDDPIIIYTSENLIPVGEVSSDKHALANTHVNALKLLLRLFL